MTIEIFSADKIDFRVNERKQYERIKKVMVENLTDSKSRHCIIVDYIIGNKQYDIIIIKNDAIISVDLKAYKGKIIGSENGKWFVQTEDFKDIEISQLKNPFVQAREQRYQLIDLLNKKLPTISKRFENNQIYRLSSILCFETGSTYDINQIDYRAAPWFNVTDEANLLNLIENTSSNEFILKDREIDALLKDLNLQRLDLTKKKKLEISDRSVLNSEDIERITRRLVEDFGTKEFSFSELSNIVDSEIAARYIGDALERKIIEKNDISNKFTLAKNWSDNIPEITEDEDIYSNSDLERYTAGDFFLKPDKSEKFKEYKGVYRGTKYHADFKGNMWWRADKTMPRIKVNFSNNEIINDILSIKPMGGSFRITESKEVLTKVFSEESGYVSTYVGTLNCDITYENYKWKPENLRKGCLWPSVYDGTTLSVNTNGDVLIHIGDIKVYAKKGHEELAKKVLELNGKYGGGRFKINENGYILTLMYRAPYPERIKNQMADLSQEEKNLIDVRKKTKRDDRVPIYVGKYTGNILFNQMFDLHREWSKEEDEEFLKRLGVC
jgi:hypothetical protein